MEYRSTERHFSWHNGQKYMCMSLVKLCSNFDRGVKCMRVKSKEEHNIKHTFRHLCM
jgi:hypothetical protein